MKHLMLGAAALALLAGCNGKDSPSAPQTQLSELTVRDGDPAKAGDALAAMALSEGSSGMLTFGERKVDGDNATFNNVRVGPGQDVVIGTLAFEGLDMDGQTATFGKMTFSDINISPEGETGLITLGKIELINPSTELAGWLAASLNGQEAPFPSVEAIEFGSWSFSDLNVNIADPEMTGAFAMDKFEIRDMADLKAARFVMSGLNFSGVSPDDDVAFTASLDEMVIGNVDAKYLKAIEDNAGDPEDMVSAVMAMAYEQPMEPGYDTFALKAFDANLGGAIVSVPSIDAFVERNGAGQVTKFVTKPYTIKVDADANGGEVGQGLLQGLSVLGYESLTFKGESVSNYDPAQDIMSFDVKNSYLELVDGARFSFGGKFGGVAEYSRKAGEAMDFETLQSGGEPDPDAMTDALGALVIYDFTFEIDDNGLLNRSLNAAATANGQDPAEMKQQLTMGLAMAPMMAGQVEGLDMTLLTDTTTALSKFVSNPGTLTLSLKPKQPLAISAMMAEPDPAAYTKDSLGYSITAK